MFYGILAEVVKQQAVNYEVSLGRTLKVIFSHNQPQLILYLLGCYIQSPIISLFNESVRLFGTYCIYSRSFLLVCL